VDRSSTAIFKPSTLRYRPPKRDNQSLSSAVPPRMPEMPSGPQ
jgi:hypothetical protein